MDTQTLELAEDQTLTELQRQQKYLAKLPEDYNYPLFNTLQALESQRSSGYKNTAAAAREIVDNSYEAGADQVHIVFETERHEGGNQQFVSAVAFIDNGPGMLPKMAQLALSWGGGSHFDDPQLIGKFGFGLPNASINQTKTTVVYTRTSPGDPLTKVRLNLNDFKDYKVQSVPEPKSVDDEDLPSFVQRYLREKSIQFDHGTIVIWDRPDKLYRRRPPTLKEHLEDDFGVAYRRILANPDRPLKIRINGSEVGPVDPLFLNDWGRYYVEPEKGGAQLRLKDTILVIYYEDLESGEFNVAKLTEHLQERVDKGEIRAINAGSIGVQISRLPLGFALEREDRFPPLDEDSRKRLEIRKPRRGISFVRSGREIDIVSQLPTSSKDDAKGKGNWPVLQGYALHWGIEIQFDSRLDEVMGVTNDKQGVRPLEDFWRVLAAAHIDDKVRAENAWQVKARAKFKPQVADDPTIPSPATQAASAADTSSSSPPITPERARPQSGQNLEDTVKKETEKSGKTPDEVRKVLKEQVRKQPYLIEFIDGSRNDPFYEADWAVYDQIVVRLNRNHPFYTVLYGSLLRSIKDNYDARRALEGINIVLFALAKAQLTVPDKDQHMEKWYIDQNTHRWSPFIGSALESLMQLMPPIENIVNGGSASEDDDAAASANKSQTASD